MKIAICDDENKVIKEIKSALSDYFFGKLIETEFFTYENGENLLNSDVHFDIAFLDVEMPVLSGIEVGKKLKEKNENIVIFMVTSFSEYLDDAFEIGAYRFLQKPLDVPRLYRSLDAALLSISNREIKFICTNDESVVIPIKSIVFCESYKRKTKIITTNGEFISKEKIGFWKGKLNEVNFYSPHASFIVNFNFIKSFNRTSLVLEYAGKTTSISIAPKKQKEFRTKMFLFAERGM